MSLIIGGGIGGLSAAYYLLKRSKNNVVVAEATKAVGGWICSVRDPETQVLFEKGPHSIRFKKIVGENTLSLIEELGLGSTVKHVASNQPSVKNRMIYVNEKLYRLPNRLPLLFKTTPPFSKPLITAVIKDYRTPAKKCQDDNLYDFAARRFGEDVAEYFATPMTCGVCAGDAKQISVKLLMSDLFNLEQQYGSVTKGFINNVLNKPRNKKTLPQPPSELNARAKYEKWTIFTLGNGLASLPQALSDKITTMGAKLLLESEVTKLNFNEDHVKYRLGDGKDIECREVISAIPAMKLAPLLKDQHPWLSEQLFSIPYVTVGVVNLAYKGKMFDHEAFGFLIPPSQNIPILGVVFDSCTFPQGDWTIVSVLMGGSWLDKHFYNDSSDGRLLEVAKEQLDTILGIKREPDAKHVSLLENCIPQYVVGHYDKVDKIFEYVAKKKLPLFLGGSTFKGIGINDVIIHSKYIAEEMCS